MKKLFLIALSLVFLIGCASTGVQLKSGAGEIAAGSTAITAGYFIGKNNPSKVADWNLWLDKLINLEPGDTVVSYEELLAKGFDLVVDEPFLELQFNKVIRSLEFPELQPPDVPFLKKEYLDLVKLILMDFKDGLQAAKAEAEK